MGGIKFLDLVPQRNLPPDAGVLRRIPYLFFKPGDDIRDFDLRDTPGIRDTTSFSFTGFLIVCDTWLYVRLYAICLSR